jgi:membrane protein
MYMLKKIYDKAIKVSGEVGSNHVGAYAAQSAYFFILCMIPIILLLLTMVQYTPVTKADVMTAVVQVFPTTVDSLIVSIVNQVYNQSTSVIPITIIVALWSAGKGVLAVTTGLNCVYKCPETRNYVYLRLRATIYTVMFIVVIIMLLLLSVFGNSLSLFISSHIAILKPVADWLMDKRIIISPIVLVGFSLLLYKFLPNRKDSFKNQIPGAVFTAIAWMALSWIFSVYLDVFRGFSNMYGSLTTIVLIMLWLYFCMYSILLGAVINKMFSGKIFEEKAA